MMAIEAFTSLQQGTAFDAIPDAPDRAQTV